MNLKGLFLPHLLRFLIYFYSSEDFDIAGGQLQVKFDRIAPNANVSHTVVVQPKKYGYFNFTAAEISYQPSEDSAEVKIILPNLQSALIFF